MPPILSGLTKCPRCGGSMYGVVNRKEKKDGSGEFYTDMWYYLCKNSKNQTGTECNFSKHIRQDIVDREVEAIVKWVLKDSDFRANVLKSVGSGVDLSGLLETEDRLTNDLRKLETKKKKLLSKINALDADDEAYDDLYDDLQSVLKTQYADIKAVNENLVQNSILIDNAKNKQASIASYSDILDCILDSIGADDMSDEVEKEIMNSIIERVDLFPEKQKDGRWVRRIQFKIPLNIEGKRYDTVDINPKDSVDKNSLPLETHVETVCLLSKLNVNEHIYVDLEMSELDITSAEKKASYEQIKSYVLEHTGLKVSHLNIAQIKRKHGIIERDCYNLPKSENSRQPNCTVEKEKAIVDALKYFKMI